MKALLIAAVFFGLHAGIKDSSSPPGYTYGGGASITVGKKPKPEYHLYDAPVYYNYNLKCPYGTFPSLNKRTTRWFCAYY